MKAIEYDISDHSVIQMKVTEQYFPVQILEKSTNLCFSVLKM